MKGWLGLALALVLATPAVPTFADEAVRGDAQESQRFDIVAIEHGHGRPRADEAPRLQHRISFDKGFSTRSFRRHAELAMSFPTRDRWIEIVRRDGEWKARMTRMRGGLVGRPEVWRPDARTIVVSFPRRWLGADADRYVWRAVSVDGPFRCNDTGTGTSSSSCVAWIDETGKLTHVLSP